MFAVGWMCLNGSCQAFWTINGGNPEADLSYNEDFLHERQPDLEIKTAMYKLVPDLLEQDQGNDSTYAYSRIAFKGMVCPNCRRCNSRKDWDAWRCETQGCDFVYAVNQPVLSAISSYIDVFIHYDGHALFEDVFLGPRAQQSSKIHGDWVITTYTLMEGNVIAHFQANKPLNKGKGGADQAFIDLQRDNCMELQRHRRPQGTRESLKQYL